MWYSQVISRRDTFSRSICSSAEYRDPPGSWPYTDQSEIGPPPEISAPPPPIEVKAIRTAPNPTAIKRIQAPDNPSRRRFTSGTDPMAAIAKVIRTGHVQSHSPNKTFQAINSAADCTASNAAINTLALMSRGCRPKCRPRWEINLTFCADN